MKFLIALGVLICCAIYRLILEISPGFYNYLCLFAIIIAVEALFFFLFSRNIRFSFKQKRKIREAREKDEQASEQLRQDLDEKVQHKIERIRQLEEELAKQQAVVRGMDVVGEKDKRYSTVTWLIEQIESHRADNVKEALNLYDAKRRRDDQAVMDRLRAKEEADRQIKQIYEDFDRDMKDFHHKKKVEEELRRIREKLS